MLTKLTITTKTTEIEKTSVEVFYNANEAHEFAQHEIKDFIETYDTCHEASFLLEGLEPYAEISQFDYYCQCKIEDFEPKGKKQVFPTFSIMREDIAQIIGEEEAKDIDDDAMEWIANKMGDHISEYYDWADDLHETYDFYMECVKK